ncbi:transketolase [Cryptosporangium sp. NPDC051539]|uniref:transketolase n=1 Tax=Cryptosporangium sp. NPDC051539 TaxID=3363962 RepID=UPI00378A5EE7
MATTSSATAAALPGAFGPDDVDSLAVETIRFLAADMVEEANSGHPGLPMGAAPMAWTLFSRHLRHDPSRSDWADRDRFVLSAGHGSALLYALLHLFGYDLPMDELRRFRQLGSATPGHPEFGHTDGVETTTGPLGQGLAMAVGLALAERMQAARYPDLTDHHTWALVGDGCLMEGVSHEAASLAGHLGLGRLVVLADDNRITIDGDVELASSDDQLARFAAYGWHVSRVDDGTDLVTIDAALTAAKADPRPSLVAVRTQIGHGAPGVEGTAKAHGSPLGAEVLAAARRRIGWPEERFHVPQVIRDRCAALAAQGAAHRAAWEQRWKEFAAASPGEAGEWQRRHARRLPETPVSIPLGAARATRVASREVLRCASEVLPELVGGSADLAGSTGTDIGATALTRDDFSGTRINFGIREFGMAAVLNGISVHGGFRVYGSTFLVFSDYLRPALRLSALMRQPVVYLLTHDSVAVGEDGPTHQPVEHIESLRLIPNVAVLRPADDAETLEAWRIALERTDGPTVLILSRQSLPPLPATGLRDLAATGARTVHDPENPDVELLATGSEVHLALAAADLLAADGVRARVRSVLWRERLPDVGRRDPGALPSVSIEAGVSQGWRGLADTSVGVETFGVSGPGEQVLTYLGLTPEAVADRIRRS